MASQHHHDMFYDTQGPARSPGTFRSQSQQQSLHRTPSRQFDPFTHMPMGLYTAEDHAAQYQTNRFDRPNPQAQPGFGYDMAAAQTWNPSGFGGAGNFAAVGATGRVKPTSRQRSALPSTWLDQHAPLPSNNAYPNPNNGPIGQSSLRTETLHSDPDEELIPTAIVIKNIPFAVKKEQLIQLMTEMNLPLPYAFNYHFDNGVFRGLAFANFTTAEETAAVIDHLNHFELQGRKLRVEYKKMLPLAERERIEREKRERRGQLEEQHRPLPSSQLQNHPSMSSLSSHIPATSPSPVSARGGKPDVDLNDPQTLQFYSELLLFKDDKHREALIFPSTLSPPQRRTVHTLAHHMSLAHVSRGNGEQRQVHVFRAPQSGSNMSPPIPQGPLSGMFSGDSHRRVLNRAATTDFSEARGSDMGMYNTLGRQSSGLLDIPASPGGNAMNSANQNLRAAKSFADLRSYTPSPVPSTASFPTALGVGISRFGEFINTSVASGTPNLTPTTSAGAIGSGRDDSLLSNGLAGISLNGGVSISPSHARNMLSFERENQQSFGGPIGSNRTFSMGYEDQSRDRNQTLPVRQPRGPATERGTGFSRPRHNGHQRGSADLDVQNNVEIIVE